MANARLGWRGVDGSLFTWYSTASTNHAVTAFTIRNNADPDVDAQNIFTQLPSAASVPVAAIDTDKGNTRSDTMLFVSGDKIPRNSIVTAGKLKLHIRSASDTLNQLHLALYRKHHWLTGQGGSGANKSAHQYKDYMTSNIDPTYSTRAALHKVNHAVRLRTVALGVLAETAASTAADPDTLDFVEFARTRADDFFGETVVEAGVGQTLTVTTGGILHNVGWFLSTQAVHTNTSTMKVRVYEWDAEALQPGALITESVNVLMTAVNPFVQPTAGLLTFGLIAPFTVSVGEQYYVSLGPSDLSEYPAYDGGLGLLFGARLLSRTDLTNADTTQYAAAMTLNTGSWTRSGFPLLSSRPQLYTGITGETIQDPPHKIQLINLPDSSELSNGDVLEAELSPDFMDGLNDVIRDPDWDVNQGFFLYLSLGGNNGATGEIRFHDNTVAPLNGVGSGLDLSFRKRRVHIS
jgi:hypothetical protein